MLQRCLSVDVGTDVKYLLEIISSYLFEFSLRFNVPKNAIETAYLVGRLVKALCY